MNYCSATCTVCKILRLRNGILSLDFLEWFESFSQLLVAERQTELVVRDLLARQNSSKISNAVLSMLGTPRIENTTPLLFPIA